MKDKAGWPFGAVSRQRQRAGWAAVVGCGLVAVVLAPTLRSRATQVVPAQTKIMVLDIAVDGRSPFHVAVPDESAAKMAVTSGLRLELIPKASGDELDAEVVEVVTDSRDAVRATERQSIGRRPCEPEQATHSRKNPVRPRRSRIPSAPGLVRIQR